MRLVQFVQVIMLLALAAYVVLIQLENPLQVRLPVPGSGVLEVPLGATLGIALLTGGLYATLLFLPVIARAGLQRRQELRARRELEEKLSVTLQAKLAATRSAHSWNENVTDDLISDAEPPDATPATHADGSFTPERA